jgi:hypothetical protein
MLCPVLVVLAMLALVVPPWTEGPQKNGSTLKTINAELSGYSSGAPAAAKVRGIAHVALPFDETGMLGRIEYKIKAPANWNGTLLVYAHQTPMFGPPQAQLAPLAWPAEGPSLEDRLLEEGYALAGSGFPINNKEGILTTLALTDLFNGRVGRPSRTIIWGNSLGGLLTLMLIEQYPGIYDGAVANCALAAGFPGDMDWALTWALAYSAVFEWREDLWGPIGDLRDNTDFWTEVVPYFYWPDSSENIVKYEFIRRMVRVPPQAFWGYDPSTGSPGSVWKPGRRFSAHASKGRREVPSLRISA